MHLLHKDLAATRPEAGAVALHFGLLILLLAAACAAGVAFMGGWSNDLFDAIRRQLF